MSLRPNLDSLPPDGDAEVGEESLEELLGRRSEESRLNDLRLSEAIFKKAEW
jgi:hypothetical protein